MKVIDNKFEKLGDDLKNTIKKAKEKYDTESNVDKSLIYFINDFRDSFRNLKNALIFQGVFIFSYYFLGLLQGGKAQSPLGFAKAF